jgi:CBS domain-containing protein
MKIDTILATKGSKVVTARPEQTIKEIIALLTQYNIGALVVLDGAGKPIGIVSERDIIHEAARNDQVLAQTVDKVMTRNISTGSPHDELESVSRTMTEKRFRHLPIMDQGKLVGIVSIGDIVKAQISHYKGEIDTLQTQIIEKES